MEGGSNGASGKPDRVLSASPTEPVVSAHSGNAPLRKKTGGLSPKRKGYEYERQSVHFFRDGGLVCERVPLSGAGNEKGDLKLKTSWDQWLKGELKRRGDLPGWIKNALGNHDFMMMRCDRGESFVMIRASLFRELCQ